MNGIFGSRCDPFSYAPAGLVRLWLLLPRVSLRFTLGYCPMPLRGFKIT